MVFVCESRLFIAVCDDCGETIVRSVLAVAGLDVILNR